MSAKTRTSKSIPATFARLLFACVLSIFTANQSIAEDWVYTVRPGDSLWKISYEYLKSPEYWPKVKAMNNVGDVLRLPPGTRLRIPVEWLKKLPQDVSIVAWNGDIDLIRDNKSQKLSSKQYLNLGDGIRTASNSSIRIRFEDGSQTLVLPNSEVYLEISPVQKNNPVLRTVIRIVHGRVENKITPLKSNRSFEVHTSAATAAVRGTEFRVSHSAENETMRSEVTEGTVAVSGSGVTQMVNAGYATVAKVGEPPIKPVQLLSAPELGGLSSGTTESQIAFSWNADSAAAMYKTQLSQDKQFSTIISEQNVESPSVEWVELTPGFYIMRVRGVDENGIEGFDALHSFSVFDPINSPRPITPADGASLGEKQPFIAWSTSGDASHYVLQLSPDEKFNNDLIEYKGVVNTHFKLQTLAPGEYYWRVQGVDVNGSKSAFSTTWKFSYSGITP